MRFLEKESALAGPAPALIDEDLDPRGNTFTWAIVILVLAGLNIGCWVFCSMVFGHPEHPFSYKLLTKLEKLEPLKGFRTTTAPSGKFHSAKDIYGTIYAFSDSQLRAYNGMLMRSYLWNYREKSPATFIFGSFTVSEVRALKDTDLFRKGILVRADAKGFPDARLEIVFPTAEKMERTDFFKKGEVWELGKSNMAAAVIEVRRKEGEPITILAVPLVTQDSGGKKSSIQNSIGRFNFPGNPEVAQYIGKT